MGIVIAIVVGAIAGWLGSKIVQGQGQGFLVNVVVGIVGAVIASLIFPILGMGAGEGSSLFGKIIYSTIGAVILLVSLRLIKRGV